MLLEAKAGSVGELLAQVKYLAGSFRSDYRAPEEIWYRGQSSASFPLLPNLYRPAVAKYHYDEASLMQRFQALARPMMPRAPSSEWEWYFLARHHGLPSRLLDWSEGLLPALYFALASHVPGDHVTLEEQLHAAPTAPSYDDDSPTVWILDAGSLNHFSVNEDAVLAPGGPRSALYLPDAFAQEHSERNVNPIALLPPRVTERIVAQQGVFTLHGRKRTPIDEIARADDRIKLARVILDRSRVVQLYEELEVLGVHRLSLFPDLDTAAAHVCWIYQSAV